MSNTIVKADTGQQVTAMARQYKGQLAAMIPSNLNYDRVFGAVAALVRNDYNIQKCTPKSIMRAAINAALMGVEIGTPAAQAHIVPRGNQANLMIGVNGWIHIAHNAGVESIFAHIVCENDEFEWLAGKKPRHVITKEELLAGRGDMIAAYAVARYRGHTYVEVLTSQDIDRFKEASGGKSQAWDKWEDEMAKKSAIKRLLKRLPMMPVQAAVRIDDEAVAGDRQGFVEPAPQEAMEVLAEDPATSPYEAPQEAGGELVDEPGQPYAPTAPQEAKSAQTTAGTPKPNLASARF